MHIRFKILVIVIFIINIQANAQRNSIKLLSYVYNNNFNVFSTEGKGIGSSKFISTNHSFAVGYERSLGNRIIVGLTGYFPYTLTGSSLSGNSMNINNDRYSLSYKMSGSGWGYDSKYFFSDLDDGSPGGGYISASYSRYVYNYESVLSYDASSSWPYGTPTGTNMSGTYNEELTFNKLGFKLGLEAAAGFFLVDYYFGVDFNSVSSTYNKPKPVELTELVSPSSFSLVFGMLFGVNF